MSALSRILVPALVAAGLAFTASAALASPGIARSAVAVHSAARSSSPIVDTLDKKEHVIVIKCSLYWCEIHHTGPDGFVLRSQLYNPFYGSKLYFQFPPVHPDPGRTTTGRTSTGR